MYKRRLEFMSVEAGNVTADEAAAVLSGPETWSFPKACVDNYD